MLSSKFTHTLLKTRNLASIHPQRNINKEQYHKRKKAAGTSTELKSLVITTIGVHERDLDYRAKSIVKWISKDKRSEIVFKPRRGISAADETTLKNLETYMKKKVEEFAEQTVTSSTLKTNKMLKIQFEPLPPKPEDVPKD